MLLFLLLRTLIIIIAPVIVPLFVLRILSIFCLFEFFIIVLFLTLGVGKTHFCDLGLVTFTVVLAFTLKTTHSTRDGHPAPLFLS